VVHARNSKTSENESAITLEMVSIHALNDKDAKETASYGRKGSERNETYERASGKAAASHGQVTH
jgi:hypothetical protein